MDVSEFGESKWVMDFCIPCGHNIGAEHPSPRPNCGTAVDTAFSGDESASAIQNLLRELCFAYFKRVTLPNCLQALSQLT